VGWEPYSSSTTTCAGKVDHELPNTTRHSLPVINNRDGQSKSKFFPQKVTLSQAAHVDVNPKGTLLKTCRCLFMSSKKAFRSYPHDF
ncbi:unnamed protein product, partial [Porites lobata]